MNEKKKILGITEGGSENSTVVNGLLENIIERGVDPAISCLYVLDGSKAFHKAVTDTFGKNVTIQQCQVHKKRNVLAQLPESEKANVGLAISSAYKEFDYSKAKAELEKLADNLDYRYPKAAASLRKGLEETLTVHKLGIPGLLRQILSNTNPIESANSICVGVCKLVSRYKDGETALRHAAAGYMEAERIGKINGLFAPPRPPPASGPPPAAAAACERGVQQDVARLCALWTCRSRWVTLRTQGFPGARASGRPVWGDDAHHRRPQRRE